MTTVTISSIGCREGDYFVGVVPDDNFPPLLQDG